MSKELVGILIGGALPAVCFGLSGPLAKASADAGLGAALYTVCVGLATIAVGGLWLAVTPESTISLRGAGYAFAGGFTWAIGALAVVIAIGHYGVPISKLVPIYNTNTLIAVVVGLWLFAEWREVDVTRLLIGAALITVGTRLVSTA